MCPDDLKNKRIDSANRASPRRAPTEVLPPSIGLPAADELIAERYLIEKPLGQGGIGVVYLARDQKMADRRVALKALLETSSSSDWLRAKFEDEMKALARLHHPNIVMATDFGILPTGRPFLVMEYVPGPTLRDRLDRGGVTLAEAADIVLQLGRALSAAHARGVIHRDLKPENVILQDLGDGERSAKMIDFGIATITQALEDGPRTTRAAGTRAYMSPEQLEGKPTHSSDVYALAAITHELLTGRLPFSAANDIELREQQHDGPKRPPSSWRADLPHAADALILRGLAFDPGQRPASALQFAEELAKALSPSGSTAGAAPVARRPPTKGASLMLVGSLSAVLLVGYLFVRPRLMHPRREPAASETQSVTNERTLEYAVIVQRSREASPDRMPVNLASERRFSAGDRIRISVSSPQDGYLYLFNEGPNRKNGLPDYNILHPSAMRNGGSAMIAAGKEIQIPARSWLVFDDEQGTERLWLVFCATREPAFDGIASVANPNDRGEIRNERQISAIRDFIAIHRRAALEVRHDTTRDRTRARFHGDVLVASLELEHR
ncbi:MAG: protein kinase [Vicinamibacteria bacterium]|nr:protein kinase [Vicinamibacteria bacterium]